MTAQDGHLGGYWLRAEYGLSQVFYIGTGIGTFQPDPTFEVDPIMPARYCKVPRGPIGMAVTLR